MVTLLHGALHNPTHPSLVHAKPFVTVGARPPVNWFAAYPATGNILGNDKLSDCCEAADIVLVEWRRRMLGLDPIPATELTDLALLRYKQIGGWSGVFPDDGGDDPGSVPQADCFGWQSAGIVAGGRVWDATWHPVAPGDVLSALAEAPLLVTLALDAVTEDDPDQWWRDLSGDVTGFHRVVGGAVRGGWVVCRTYGLDVPVSRTRVVGVDLMRFVG